MPLPFHFIPSHYLHSVPVEVSFSLCAAPGEGEPQEILENVLKWAWGKDTGDVSWEMSVAD